MKINPFNQQNLFLHSSTGILFFIFSSFFISLSNNSYSQPHLNWVKNINARTGYVITIDDDGAIVFGDFSDTVTFGLGEFGQSTLISDSLLNQGLNIFIARYTNEGELSWARKVGSERFANSARPVIIDGTSSAIIAGVFDTNAIFGVAE